MGYAISILSIFAAAWFAVRCHQARETRMELTTVIDRPASRIFNLIEEIECEPLWNRYPGWLPGPLRISAMSALGEHIPGHQARSRARSTPPREIRIRCFRDREFSCLSIHPRNVTCESTFRLYPDHGKCLLNWEIRYRSHRFTDMLRRREVAAAVRASMTTSLEHLRRRALDTQPPIYLRSTDYEARRGQIPAA